MHLQTKLFNDIKPLLHPETAKNRMHNLACKLTCQILTYLMMHDRADTGGGLVYKGKAGQGTS